MVTVLGADGIGYGIRNAPMGDALNHDIDVIAMDGGSTDYGANYLSDGTFIADEGLCKKDLAHMLRVREDLEVPLLIGNVGGGGTNRHVDKTKQLVADIASAERYELKVACIYTDVDRQLVADHIEAGAVSTLHYDAELTKETVETAEDIVSFVGPAPYLDAIRRGADVVLGGRSLDVSPYSAVPLLHDAEKADAVTLSKLMECGTYVCEQPADSTGYLIGEIGADSVELRAPAEDHRITTSSAISMLMYEKADPNYIYLPDGVIDVSQIRISENNDGSISFGNTVFNPSERPSILIEGNELAGYRTIAIAGINDPVTISKIDAIIDDVRAKTEANIDAPPSSYDLNFRKYGIDAVSLYDSGTDNGETDDVREIGIVIDAMGDTQSLANSVCSMARTTLFHEGFEGRLSISGNVAHGILPVDIPAGPVYKWTIRHLVEGVNSMSVSDVELEGLP